MGKCSCIPEGNTPGKTKPKRKKEEKRKGAMKLLFKVSEDLNVPTVIDGSGTKCVNGSWTTAELTALVQHICLYWDGAHTDKWPCNNEEHEILR
jgi:hypothetical protein